MNGYQVKHSEIIDSDMNSISVYNAEKGKIFSKKYLFLLLILLIINIMIN